MVEGFHSSADKRTLRKVIDLALAHKETPKIRGGALAPEFENYIEQLVRFATGEDRYWD